MSHHIITIYKFDCDNEDCSRTIKAAGVRKGRDALNGVATKREATEEILANGWTAPARDEHYCPDHNDKEPPEEVSEE